MECLTCLFMVNLMSGCFLFKMFKTLNEFCFLSKVATMLSIYVNENLILSMLNKPKSDRKERS